MRWLSDHRPDQLSARSDSSLFVETVSDAIKCLDCIEVRIRCAELPADAFDVAVDRAIVDVDVVLVSDVEQLIACLDDARALGERFQDQEFGDGQRNILPAPQYFMPRWVH